MMRTVRAGHASAADLNQIRNSLRQRALLGPVR